MPGCPIPEPLEGWLASGVAGLVLGDWCICCCCCWRACCCISESFFCCSGVSTARILGKEVFLMSSTLARFCSMLIDVSLRTALIWLTSSWMMGCNFAFCSGVSCNASSTDPGCPCGALEPACPGVAAGEEFCWALVAEAFEPGDEVVVLWVVELGIELVEGEAGLQLFSTVGRS